MKTSAIFTYWWYESIYCADLIIGGCYNCWFNKIVSLLGTKKRVVFVVWVVSVYKPTGNLNSDGTIRMFQRLKFMNALFISTLSRCVVFVILSQTCEAYVNISIVTTSLHYWSDTILLEEPLFEYGSFLFHIYWIC